MNPRDACKNCMGFDFLRKGEKSVVNLQAIVWDRLCNHETQDKVMRLVPLLI